MALAGYDPVIPLDEVIETARRVAGQMPRELRCTALGGLSITATSLAIEKKLQQRRPAARHLHSDHDTRDCTMSGSEILA